MRLGPPFLNYGETNGMVEIRRYKEQVVYLKIILLLTFILLVPEYCLADSVRISQIDASQLLLNQKVRLFVGVSDEEGRPVTGLTKENFRVAESGDEGFFIDIPDISRFHAGTNYEMGIHFLLLLDNSGSMYRTPRGGTTTDLKETRMELAKAAVRSFLNSITNPKDMVGLVSYNSFYTRHSPLTGDIPSISGHLLDEIKKPEKDEVYSEIYGSLTLAVDEFRTVSGRKAVIILSDGYNRPYFLNTKKKHPVFGEETISYRKAVRFLQREGISLHVIHLGLDPTDQNLSKIATQTGGMTFHAFNLNQLKRLYSKIVEQILHEYCLTYSATTEPGDRKHVRVTYTNGREEDSVTRVYFSSTVFGYPDKDVGLWVFIPFAIAVLSLWGMMKIPFKGERENPALEVIKHKSGRISRKTVPLIRDRTIIGNSHEADIKAASHKGKNKATIAYDEKEDLYTLLVQGEATVNNRAVKKKKLESGDVININGMTMVFDGGKK